MNYQKSLVALAVAGAIAAPQLANAEADLYGRVRTGLNYNDPGNNDGWDIVNLTSRLGVKGSEDLGNGLEATYRYEFKVDGAQDGGLADDNSGRIASAGLKGGFGHIRIGQMWNVIYNNIAFIDYLATGSANGYYSNVSPSTRSGDQLQYTLSYGGLSFAAAAVITDENDANNEEEIDRFDFGATWSGGPLTIGAAIMATADRNGPFAAGAPSPSVDDEFNVFGVGGTWDVIEGLQLGAIFTTSDEVRNERTGTTTTALSDDDKTSADLSVRWSPIATWDFDFQYAFWEVDDGTQTNTATASGGDAEAFMLSATKRLSKRTRLGAIWRTVMIDEDIDLAGNKTDDTDDLWLLVRHDF